MLLLTNAVHLVEWLPGIRKALDRIFIKEHGGVDCRTVIHTCKPITKEDREFRACPRCIV